MSLISLSGIGLRYDNNVLLDGADLNIAAGDSLALVGRNGCGKTSLLKIIAGVIEPDSGKVERIKGVKTAYLPQDVPTNLSGTMYECAAQGLGDDGKTLVKYRRLQKLLEKNNDHSKHAEFDAVVRIMEEKNLWNSDVKIAEILERLQLDPSLELSTVSAGLKRRALLARELASNPDILILDEPTNHLDIDSVIWLEKFLKNCGKTLVFVSHDRVFLQNLSQRVAEVDRGKLISFDCDFATFLRRRDELLAAQARNDEVFDKKLAQEEAWLRQGVKARRTRNEGRVKELMRLRNIRGERRNRQGAAGIKIQEAEQTGEKVIDAKNISVAFSGRPIISDFSTAIFRGDKIGIIGKNGVGKTTLLNALLGNIKPDSGEVLRGTRLQPAYFDQLRKDLNPRMKPFDFVGGGGDHVIVGGASQSVSGYLQNFLFAPEQIYGEIAMLSGGEKNRLLLAKLFSEPANVLVLDEPTNDLDMETIEILESALVNFGGTILLVSHDRAFLNNIVTASFCFDDDGKIIEIVGGYDDWETMRARKAPVDSRAEEKKSPAVQTPKKREKFTNKEREELANLPDRIAAVEAEQEEISAKLQDSDFIRSNIDKLESLNARLEALRLEDEVLMERWTTLEERKAALENG